MEGYALVQLIANKPVIVGKINNAEQKKSTEEVMGLFVRECMEWPVLTMLFVHSCNLQ